MPTEHNIRQLIINKLTDEEYEQAVKSADELYLTPDSGSGGGTDLPDQTGQSGKFLTTNGSTLSWGTVPAGTVTSVRVQAGTGLSSSQSTAQSLVLNTKISIASGYKLPTTTEWSNKQDALPSQSGQSGKFLSTNGSSLYWASTGGGGSGYVPLPTVTTLTDTTYTLTVAENTIYKFSNAITSLTISSITISDLESLIYFTTGSSITFVDNSTLKWGGGSIPSLDTNTTYCIAIKNGLAELDKFGR